MNTRIRRSAAVAGFAVALAGAGLAATPIAAAVTPSPTTIPERASSDPLRGGSAPSCVQYLIDHLVAVGCDTPGVAVYRVLERAVIAEALCPAETEYVYTSGGGIDTYGPVTCLQKLR